MSQILANHAAPGLWERLVASARAGRPRDLLQATGEAAPPGAIAAEVSDVLGDVASGTLDVASAWNRALTAAQQHKDADELVHLLCRSAPSELRADIEAAIAPLLKSRRRRQFSERQVKLILLLAASIRGERPGIGDREISRILERRRIGPLGAIRDVLAQRKAYAIGVDAGSATPRNARKDRSGVLESKLPHTRTRRQ